MNEKPSYTEAFEELQEIVAQIEEEEISVDELSAKVKRASRLISICKKKLATTEEDVDKILRELDTVTEENDQDDEQDNESENDNSKDLPF